jgi:hypothetical protein
VDFVQLPLHIHSQCDKESVERAFFFIPVIHSFIHMIFTFSSDILACFCTFLASDHNVVHLFMCCKKTTKSQFLAKVNLKGTYQQSDCDRYKTLSILRKRIRTWTAFINIEDIPPALHKLNFDCDYTMTDCNVQFPPFLKEITFGFWFNRSIDNVKFPSSLQQLTLSYLFNKKIDNVTFPITLKQLTFGYDFNQNIDNVKFPSSLQQLTFGSHFNQNINNVIFPVMLTRLTFGVFFNQNIDNVKFPSSLQQLVVGCNFKHSTVHLPSSLQITGKL